MNIKFTFPTLLLLILLIPFTNFAQNSFVIQNCRVTPLANYNIKKPKAEDAAKLIDNIYSKRDRSYIFQSGTTLGWRKTTVVTIDLTLKQECLIKAIYLNSPSNTISGIGLPLVTSVFVGKDTSSFMHVLDYDYPEDKATSTFSVVDMKIDNINATGKYLRIIVTLSTLYFLCDEIKVDAVPVNKMESKGSGSSARQRIFTYKTIPSYIDSLKATQLYKVQLNSSLMEVISRSNSDRKVKENFKNIQQKLKAIHFIDDKKYDSLKRIIQRSSLSNVTNAIQITEEDPFEDTLVEIKPVSSANTHLKMNATLFIGASSFKAIRLINANTEARKITVKTETAGDNCKLALFQPKFILARSLMISPDAWIPLPLKENSFVLQPGENQLLFIKLTGVKGGSSSIRMIVDGGNNVISGDITVNYSVANINLNDLQLPYSVNWAYLNRPFYKGLEKQAYQDLLNHHINIMVVPANMMYARGLVFDAAKTASYIKKYRGFDKYLCFFNAVGYIPKIFNEGTQTISPDYLKQVSNWYDSLLLIAKTMNISPNQVLIYPIDEMAGKLQTDFFQAFQKWFHSTYPQKVIYATINSMNSLDIAFKDKGNIYQIVYDTTFFEKAKPNTDNVKWLYDFRNPSKGLSPNSYYRLMAWKAFKYNFTGLGFWNYADLDHAEENSEWNDYDGMMADYVVVYRYNGNIIPSRRWEAFALGLEDYALLRAYEKKFGRQRAADICNKVINNSSNTLLPDQVRETILKAL